MQSLDMPIFSLSTLHTSTDNALAAGATAVTPRCRTVVCRGFWASLPENSKNTAPLNPATYESDLPVITTDARMDKVGELVGPSKGGSSPGGPVEGVFWIPNAMTQWRLRGHAYILGPDIDSETAAGVREAVGKHMRRQGDHGDWSWSREVTAHFGNLSPGMRGQFRNPPPGTPITQKPGEGLGMGHKIDDLEDPIARSNFRVVVIVPEEVDHVDLTVQDLARRWNYKLKDDGTWDVEEVWP